MIFTNKFIKTPSLNLTNNKKLMIELNINFLENLLILKIIKLLKKMLEQCL